MKKTILQIYEIQTPEEAARVVDAGVDHVGSVIVSVKRWKQPEIKRTVEFVAGTDAKSSLILLFNEPDLVFESLNYYRPDIVHFCEILVNGNGNTLSDHHKTLVFLQEQVREKFPEIKIMRTIPIPDSECHTDLPFLDMAKKFEPVSDYFLTDTLIVSQTGNDEQPVNGFVGITGKTCDWVAAARLVAHSRIPVILAGGLSPENVYEGIKAVCPAGVDSCTQTNACDSDGHPIRFKKDMAKVRQFLSETRRADAECRSD